MPSAKPNKAASPTKPLYKRYKAKFCPCSRPAVAVKSGFAICAHCLKIENEVTDHDSKIRGLHLAYT